MTERAAALAVFRRTYVLSMRHDFSVARYEACIAAIRRCQRAGYSLAALRAHGAAALAATADV